MFDTHEDQHVHTEVIPILMRMAMALERIADQSGKHHDDSSVKASRQSQAIAWVASTGVTDSKSIAERFNVDQRTVRRWAQLRKLIDGMRLQERRGRPRKGFRSDLGIEATDE